MNKIVREHEEQEYYNIIQLLFLFEGHISVDELMNMDTSTLHLYKKGRERHINEILEQRKKEEEKARKSIK